MTGALVGSMGILLYTQATLHAQSKSDESNRLVTVYDRGATSTFVTTEATLDAALRKAQIELDDHDTVEPSIHEELVASEYHVNIYRARPVIVVDGSLRTKIMTPYQTPYRIAEDAGIGLYPEDAVSVTRLSNIVRDGAGLEMTITRAVPFVLDLHGRINSVRTLGKTVGEMLIEKGISLDENGRVSVPLEAPIVAGMMVRIWQEGVQTTSIDEAVPFSVEQIYDADRPLGYMATKTEGKNGIRTITYEIEIKDGREVSRKEIARIITAPPVKKVVVVGIKGIGQGLTKSKGAIYHTDSKGVVHRETYYDLDMRRVMQSCGQGGRYTVRIDGVKIDADGYVIVAANYGLYPKCSIVETSVGPGKVYDTGGFALRHPHGFDIATDWSRSDGI